MNVVLVVTCTCTSEPSWGTLIEVGDTSKVGSPAVWLRVRVSDTLEPPAPSTVICWVLASTVSFSTAFKVKVKVYWAVAPGSPSIATPFTVLEPFAWYSIEEISSVIILPAPFLKVSFWEFDLPVIVTTPPALSTAGELLSKLTNSFLGNRFAVNFLGSETPGAVTVNSADCLTRLPLLGVCAFTFKVVSPLPVLGFTTIPFWLLLPFFFIYLFHRKSCICVHLISILKIVLFR